MKPFGQGRLRFSLTKRGKMFNEKIIETSPGAIYNSAFDLVEIKRYKDIGFGYGKKIADFTSSNTSEFPGPGQYKLPSIFDKFFSR